MSQFVSQEPLSLKASRSIGSLSKVDILTTEGKSLRPHSLSGLVSPLPNVQTNISSRIHPENSPHSLSFLKAQASRRIVSQFLLPLLEG